MWKMYARFASALCKISKSDSRAVRTRRQLSITASKARKIEEQKIKVDDMEINYAKVGTGSHPVLLFPGILGTIWTDFKPQLENLNVNKLTVVAWDPPGNGKSRPPDRTFPDDFLQRDAAYAHNLMKTLGYSKFSLIGWSAGGISSILLASAYPDSVCKLAVTGTMSYMYLETINNVSEILERIKTPMVQVYDEDYYKKTCAAWIDALLRLCKRQNGNLCKHVLPKINCPTLIIHGAKDALVLPEHPIYLNQKIANSQLHIFESGTHDFHLKYPEEFNKLVVDFLVD